MLHRASDVLRFQSHCQKIIVMRVHILEPDRLDLPLSAYGFIQVK
jgi:hypothetical protein